MTATDFITKLPQIAQSRGLKAAATTAVTEPGMKLARPIIQQRATPIWDGDWDIALILDACRVDALQAVADEYKLLPDSIPARWSVGSASPEWISNTFANEHRAEYADVGYVTANPFTAKEPGAFRSDDVYPVRDLPLAYLDEVFLDQWESDGYHTVVPDVMTGRARYLWDNRREHGVERMVVHYMQPHMPFRTRPEWFNGWGGTDKFGEVDEQEDRDIWIKLRDGEIDKQEFWTAYLDTLRWVLDEVQRWVTTTDARVLITADHGNGKGEWGVWSHPPGVIAPAVKRVPWVLVDGERKQTMDYEVRGDPPVVSSNGVENVHDMKDRLEALGYR